MAKLTNYIVEQCLEWIHSIKNLFLVHMYMVIFLTEYMYLYKLQTLSLFCLIKIKHRDRIGKTLPKIVTQKYCMKNMSSRNFKLIFFKVDFIHCFIIFFLKLDLNKKVTSL